ncbi:MAG: DUF2520 domain-containing protein [Lachnospiraceae bacterium]|nr:DUF2520 domain-containing protein [Lachnospiraceae bacterium]
MKIGFIGAGKMGFTLGKHFEGSPLVELVGYYSKSPQSAKEAALFTDTEYYEDIGNLVDKCDALFLTVPDDQIAVTAEMLDGLDVDLKGKIICHTSGALSSQVFSDMQSHVYGYSIHPIYAVSSKTQSYENFNKCFITIEGHEKYKQQLVELFASLGHEVKVISPDDKVRYHSSAVMASNLVIGLYYMAQKELMKCGFSYEETGRALGALFEGNADRLLKTDVFTALTGPVERCDRNTVNNHISVLDGDALNVYKLLSKQLVEIAEVKNEDRQQREEYSNLLNFLS